MEKFDIAVIGGGPGGYPCAIRASQLGASVVLIEKEKLGGTCLNWGCIPTKSLICSASVFRNMKRSEQFGVKAVEISFDYAAMAERKDRIVEKLRSGISQLLKANGVPVIEGTASFAGRNRISVQNGSNSSVIEAANTVIASGSIPLMPKHLPKSPAILDSRDFLELSSLPGSLIIMGGGVIGCEFACMAAQLGVRVVIVEMLPDILSTLDTDVRSEARRHMEKDLNISIVTGNPMEGIEAGKDGVKAQAGGKQIEADMLLVAVGRKPNATVLTPDVAGVTVNPHGFIEIDTFCRTRAATVYAIGDVAGGPQLAHYATAQGIMAAELIAGKARRGSVGVVPACIFTVPEIGTAGFSEQDALKQDRQIIVGKFSFAASGKAMASGEAFGFVKWIADSATGQLLGAQAVGPHATELIAEATAAIRFEITARELARTIHAHPTLSEAWMEAAHAVHGQCIHAPPRRKKTEKKPFI